MKEIFYFSLLIIISTTTGCAQNKKEMKADTFFRPLTSEEERVIVGKGTEAPYTGEYDKFYESGIYVCKRCGSELYKSTDKFNSGCGWPSFDDEIKGAVKRTTDKDGRRTEITCNSCGGHLGHVFLNEGLTKKNTRHCVNSIALQFIPEKTALTNGFDIAYFAGGCFWGVEYYLEQESGVISVESGYMGGRTNNPTYEEVCSHASGHAELVQVTFDPAKVSFETLAKLFFEIHDPTHLNHQGPDIGDQYRSEIFYQSVEQKEIAQKLINQLKAKGYNVVTQLSPVAPFWKAEEYHQNYYNRKQGTPYCHKKINRFGE